MIDPGAFPCRTKQSRRNVAASSYTFGERNGAEGGGGFSDSPIHLCASWGLVPEGGRYLGQLGTIPGVMSN